MLSVQSAPPTQFAGESDGSTVAVLTEFLGFGDALGTARVMIDADATTGTDGDTGSGGRRVAGCVFVALDPEAANHRPARQHVPRPSGDMTGTTSLAVAVDRPARLVSVSDFEQWFPAVAADLRDAGLESVACLPVVSPDGTVVGVVGMASAAPVDFDGALRATLTELASQTVAHATLRR